MSRFLLAPAITIEDCTLGIALSSLVFALSGEPGLCQQGGADAHGMVGDFRGAQTMVVPEPPSKVAFIGVSPQSWRQFGHSSVRIVPSANNPPASQEQPAVTESIHDSFAINGLRMSRAVITGIVDPKTLTASCYWTFKLHNDSGVQKEARLEVRLPDGAVVSRATLWIDGKPQEAAFNSTWQVANAYDWIVNRHRDPLLVSYLGKNLISIKASPVMPRHDMQIRIGITIPLKQRQNQICEFELPKIEHANVALSCQQNVHLASSAPLKLGTDASAVNGAQFLLKSNLNLGKTESYRITVPRKIQLLRFATRATHSLPRGYIVAELRHDPGTDHDELRLTKSLTKPDCTILLNDDAAYRLSYLWVKDEIEQLVGEGREQEAVELATVYRVVSPVSGAVVLERESDYEYNGLDRKMFRSTGYESRKSVPGQLAGGAGGADLAVGMLAMGASTKRALGTPVLHAVPNLPSVAQASPTPIPVPHATPANTPTPPPAVALMSKMLAPVPKASATYIRGSILPPRHNASTKMGRP